MMHLIRRFKRNDEGAALLEFAIVAVPIFLLILSVMEFGLMSFTRVTIEGTLTQAARTATIGSTATTGCDRASAIVALVRDRIRGLPNNDQADVTAAVVTAPGTSATVPKDVCLDDPRNPYPATCSGSYIDNNSNGHYDAPTGATCFGGNGDLVEIRVTYPWRVLTPFLAFFYPHGVNVINTTIIVKNEPSLT